MPLRDVLNLTDGGDGNYPIWNRLINDIEQLLAAGDPASDLDAYDVSAVLISVTTAVQELEVAIGEVRSMLALLGIGRREAGGGE